MSLRKTGSGLGIHERHPMGARCLWWEWCMEKVNFKRRVPREGVTVSENGKMRKKVIMVNKEKVKRARQTRSDHEWTNVTKSWTILLGFRLLYSCMKNCMKRHCVCDFVTKEMTRQKIWSEIWTTFTIVTLGYFKCLMLLRRSRNSLIKARIIVLQHLMTIRLLYKSWRLAYMPRVENCVTVFKFCVQQHSTTELRWD